MVETLSPQVLLCRRIDGEWSIESYQGLDVNIELPKVQLRLPLADIYERFTFGPRRHHADEAPLDA